MADTYNEPKFSIKSMSKVMKLIDLATLDIEALGNTKIE